MQHTSIDNTNRGSHSKIKINNNVIKKEYSNKLLSTHYHLLKEAIGEYRNLTQKITNLEIPRNIDINIANDTLTTEDQYIKGKTIVEILNAKPLLRYLDINEVIENLTMILYNANKSKDVPIDATPSNFIISSSGNINYVDFYPPLQIIYDKRYSKLKRIFFNNRSTESISFCFNSFHGNLLKLTNLIKKDTPHNLDLFIEPLIKILKSINQESIADSLIDNINNNFTLYEKIKSIQRNDKDGIKYIQNIEKIYEQL